MYPADTERHACIDDDETDDRAPVRVDDALVGLVLLAEFREARFRLGLLRRVHLGRRRADADALPAAVGLADVAGPLEDAPGRHL